ncbi:DoxX family membrane protein [Rhodococcoides fascians A25f]|uniref:DoxX family protein n=1 Tax=Rhodococcoides fascians TaxID=1828 RepID=UPI0005688BBA|nr:DoxX family membrane protein [Rhodococcus fascians]QII07342.1 DoxX family membrane protein [Rhodococcus fascians A25f]
MLSNKSDTRSGRDILAPLLLRSLIGGTMVAHGLKHGRSIDGTAGWFGSIGFRRPRLQAQASAAVETAAGAALVAGAATPVAAAAVVATMAVAARSVHVQNGFFITSEGWEYVANLATAATALAALGPGRFSVDRLLGWDTAFRGDKAVAGVLALGIAAAATQLAVFHRRVEG